MNFKSLSVAALLSFSVVTAWATTVPVTLTDVGLHASGGYTVTHAAGEFSDTFTFLTSLGAGTVDTSFLNSASGTVSGITFTGATLNGNALSFAGGTLFPGTYTTIGALSPTYITGPLILTVTGFSGANASYAGTLNLVTTAVPEPETYAMMLAGLALVSFAARRRKAR